MAGLEIFTSQYAVEQPESRGLNGDGSAYQYIFKVFKDQVNDLIPDNGLLDPNGQGFHDRSKLLVVNGPVFSTVTLTFVSDVDSVSGSLANRKEAVVEWSRSSGLTEVPLSEVTGYRMRWEYDLYQAVLTTADTTPTIPGFFATATNNSDTLNFSDSSLNYRWAKSQPSEFTYKSKTYSWVRVTDRTKPGVESKEISVFIVIGSKPYKRKKDAIAAALATPDTLVAPAETFGLPSTASRWKYNPTAGPYQDGEWWVNEYQFKYNPNGWDEDIYP